MPGATLPPDIPETILHCHVCGAECETVYKRDGDFMGGRCLRLELLCRLGAGVLKNIKRMIAMPKFYFTYGTDPAYPFKGGWTRTAKPPRLKEDLVPMKIERRLPANLYRKPKKRRLRDSIPVAAVVKYATLTIVGVILFCSGQARALAERGHKAIGGEGFALFLPVLYWMVSSIVKDVLNARKGSGTWR